jgi:hypothetical protein
MGWLKSIPVCVCFCIEFGSGAAQAGRSKQIDLNLLALVIGDPENKIFHGFPINAFGNDEGLPCPIGAQQAFVEQTLLRY